MPDKAVPTVLIFGIVVVVVEVPAPGVIDVAVGVVVLAVAGDLTGVGPELSLQVCLAEIDARIDQRDVDPRAGDAGVIGDFLILLD